MSPRGHRGWNDRARAKAEAVKRQRQLAVERPVLDTIRALRAEGRSWRAVAACLEGRFDPPGHRGKWAAGSWTHKSVQRIARRHGIADAASAETPRSPPPPPAPTRQPTLADLDLEETLTARCPRCHHARTLDHTALAHRLGAHTELEQVRRRLRCSACAARDVALHRARAGNRDGVGLPTHPDAPEADEGGRETPEGKPVRAARGRRTP